MSPLSFRTCAIRQDGEQGLRVGGPPQWIRPVFRLPLASLMETFKGCHVSLLPSKGALFQGPLQSAIKKRLSATDRHRVRAAKPASVFRQR